MGTYGPKATSAPTGAIILHPGDNISALVSAAPTGTTFYFEPGVYRGVSLAPKDGQAFIGAEGAILNGSAVLSNWTQSGNLWVIGGQTQQGRVHPDAEFEPGTQRPGYPETVFLDNTPLKPVDALSKVVPGTFYFDYAADKIYIADSPTDHTVEAGKLTDAFHGSATNVTVQNLVIEKYDPQIQDGAIRGGQGWTIRDNEVRLNYAVGISANGGSQIIGNYVHDNGQMGLGGSGNEILVQGNEIAKNGFWSGIDPLWEGGGFKFSNTDDLVVRGNYVHDNKGTGLWTDINNIHTLYEDNVVVHNTINGISHEISYDAIIRNNTLFGNGYGDTRGWGWGSDINIQNSQNVEVYGNRVEMTGGGNGIVMIQQNRGSGTFGTYTTTGNQIHDNTIVDHDGHGYIGGFADYNQSGMLNGGNTWSDNQYFMSDGGGRFQWGGSKTFPQFKDAAHETGSISQSYPDTSGWLTASPADATPVRPVVTAPDFAASHNQNIAASALFSVTDGNGDAITKYQFWDSTTDSASGHWVVNGMVQGTNQAIDVTAAQLAQTTFQSGSGSDDLWVRAFDGFDWSEWKEFHVNAPVEARPVVTAPDFAASHNQNIAASALFSVTDGNGDAITKYQFWDSTTDSASGHWVVNGMVQGTNQAIDVTAAQLAQTTFQSGSGSDDLWVRAFDGFDWSEWKEFHVNAPVEARPVVTAPDFAASHNQNIAASALFSVTDGDGDAITKYQFWDSTTDPASGHWVVNGMVQGTNQAIDVTAAQLAQTTFQSGSGSDDLWVRAFDGFDWSEWKEFHVNAPVDQKPVVSGSDAILPLNGSVPVMSLFSVSDSENDPIIQYQFWDSTPAATSGHFEINGTPQGANQAIDVSAAQVNQTGFVAGSVPGVDQIWERAFDGSLWSDWHLLSVTGHA